ncbi:MAG: tetratricopeptide repeat protein [Planctomycetota bacterium]
MTLRAALALLLFCIFSGASRADGPTALKYLNESNAAIERGEYEEAERLATRAVEEAPGEPDLWCQRAVTRIYLERIPGAYEDLARSEALEKARPEPRNSLLGNLASARCSILTGQGRYREALGQADEAIRLRPDDAGNVAVRGRILVLLGNPEEGIPLIRKVADLDPGWCPSYCSAMVWQADWQAVLDYALKGEKGGNTVHMAEFFKGVAGTHLGHAEECLQLGVDLTASGKDLGVGRALQGYVLSTPGHSKSNPVEGLAIIRQASGLPDVPNVEAIIARSFYYADRCQDAIDHLASRSDGPTFLSLFWRGAAEWKLERFADARATFSDARRMNPHMTKYAQQIPGLPEFLTSIDRVIASELASGAKLGRLDAERTTWIFTFSEIATLVRRYEFTRAAKEYERLIPTIVSPVLKSLIEGRLADVKGMGATHDKLVAAVNKKGFDGQVKVAGLDLVIVKADDRAFDFKIPRGSGKFPWAYLDPMDYCRLAAPPGITPADRYALAVLLWDSEEDLKAQQALAEAAKDPALKARVDGLVSRKRGLDTPAGGFVTFKGRFVTPEEKENLEKGLVRFQGKWVTPADKDKLAKGMVKVGDKWLPGDEKKLAEAGYRKFKDTWMSAEDYAEARSAWENAFEQETAHFKIRSNAGEQFTQDLAEVAELGYAEMKKFWDGREPKLAKDEKLTLYAFGGFNDYRRHCAERKADSNINAAGFATSDSPVVAGWNKTGNHQNFLKTMVHEAAHLYYFRTSTPTGLKSWHAEGLATYFEGFQRKDGKWLFTYANTERLAFAKRAFSDGSALSLKDLMAADALVLINSDGQKALTFYAQCWSLNYFLSQTSDEAYRTAYKEYRMSVEAGKSDPLSKYVKDMAALEKEWKAYIASQ